MAFVDVEEERLAEKPYLRIKRLATPCSVLRHQHLLLGKLSLLLLLPPPPLLVEATLSQNFLPPLTMPEHKNSLVQGDSAAAVNHLFFSRSLMW